MRNRYWGSDDAPAIEITSTSLPTLYAEWAEASYNAILENGRTPSSRLDSTTAASNKNQTLLDRIDNLQNMLFVIDAEQVGRIRPLNGATYWLIPPLLIPRVLWPSKPRSHEGQILLNVHFGRQDFDSTFTTYIAWGLLPEAYGNFGPIAGCMALGLFLGALFAWIENLSARKLVMSMEGFVSLGFIIGLLNSFEMVASVLVTSVFQSTMVIIAASFPFVQRTKAPRRQPDEEPQEAPPSDTE
jgi:hypothetical protein